MTQIIAHAGLIAFILIFYLYFLFSILSQVGSRDEKAANYEQKWFVNLLPVHAAGVTCRPIRQTHSYVLISLNLTQWVHLYVPPPLFSLTIYTVSMV